ncbi:MAG: glycosyltransferase family 2 protein [Patescibacteria group bacterium]
MNFQHIGKASDLLKRGDRYLYRFFEMVPGLLTWITLGAVIVCSFFFPTETALFIIVFDMYWLVKTVYLSLHLRVAYSQVRKNLKIDWLAEVEKLGTDWHDLYHLILLPTYREPLEVIRDSIKGLQKSHYPQDRMIVVLAQEERAGKAWNEEIARTLTEEFQAIFFKFIVTEHPADIAGEIAAKGANIAWAGKQVVRDVIDAEAIAHDRVLVSVFDIDTVVYPEYFARLTHAFLTTENPLRASYQPIPFFTNNIWEAPSFARVVAFSSTFWQTIQQERPENLITFSSHSMPLTAVVDIGFWQANMVNEDSRVFWQCFLRYDGDYKVVPLYYPVAMDANVAPTSLRTVLNVYKQHRRWSYGSENVPYFLFGFIKNRKIAFQKKFFYTLMILEGYWSWATNALILFLLGWLPGFVGGPGFNGTVLSFNHTYLSQTIMRLALIALFTPVLLSLFILPPRPPKFGKFQYFWMVVQWILFPLTTIFLGSIPALDAQTRLMLGKYMGFWITPKHRPGALSTESATSAHSGVERSVPPSE